VAPDEDAGVVQGHGGAAQPALGDHEVGGGLTALPALPTRLPRAGRPGVAAEDPRAVEVAAEHADDGEDEGPEQDDDPEADEVERELAHQPSRCTTMWVRPIVIRSRSCSSSLPTCSPLR